MHKGGWLEGVSVVCYVPTWYLSSACAMQKAPSRLCDTQAQHSMHDVAVGLGQSNRKAACAFVADGVACDCLARPS